MRVSARHLLWSMLCGLDEAGRGPAYGPLVAAAVTLHQVEQDKWRALTDSKKLTPKARERLYETIVEDADVGIGIVTNDEIDTRGLGECQKLVFHRALDALVERGGATPGQLIVDGLVFEQWRNVPYECKPRADATVACVSAASIVAKVTHDRLIAADCDVSPDLHEKYDLRNNKGYLSAKHTEGLRVHGFSAGHRKSFRIRAVEKSS